jgi:uncharacterized protein YjbI with pentapeptide repeats/endonuclease YncB( thermonuclease family)
MRRLAGLTILSLALVIAIVVLADERRWQALSALGVAGLFVAGCLLWWWAATEKKWDEIGRTIMVSALLAAMVGVLQFLIDQRQKERDFDLSLTLQDNLSGADLHGKPLSGVRLRGKKLVDADLHSARLKKANLASTLLSGATLDHAILTRADLRRSHLEGASLIGAHLSGVNLKNGHLAGANLRGADLSGAILDIADFNGACLAGANLRNASVAGADFTGAVLTGADVRGARFESDLRPANLTETGLAGVRYDSSTVWPSDFAFWPAVAGHPFPVQLQQAQRPSGLIPARVTEVEDGDTIRLQTDAAHRLVLPEPGRARLIGLNAPNPQDPGGPAATKWVAGKLLGRMVGVEVGVPAVDDGGRYRVYIWLSGGETFNEQLLDTGYVQLQGDAAPPFADRFAAAELRAKQRGTALWSRCPSPG